jgi:hypothetical protein
MDDQQHLEPLRGCYVRVEAQREPAAYRVSFGFTKTPVA